MRDLYRALKTRVKAATLFDAVPHTGPPLQSLVNRLESAVRQAEYSRGDEVYFKALVLLCEIHDYFGRFKPEFDLARFGASVLDDLPAERISASSFGIVQAKVRLATAYARSLYRQNEPGQAWEIVNRSRRYVHDSLATTERPCLGTLGELAYVAGRILRQQQKLRESLVEFNRAIKLYDDRASWKVRTKSTDADEEVRFSVNKCATILALGAGWANYNSGFLNRAVAENLIPARIILRRSGDLFNNAYADVIYASTLRALGREGDDSLTYARGFVAKAIDVFTNPRHAHPHYAAGAFLELALIDLAKRDFDEAEVDLGKMQSQIEANRALGYEDQRWACSALIVRSRLDRHRAEKGEPAEARVHARTAELSASEALRIAAAHEEPLGRIDALIARSEATTCREYSEDDLQHAISDLNDALKINRSLGTNNPKIEGLCHLHLSRLHARRARHLAAMHFHKWQGVSSQVEHARLHSMAARIEEDIGLSDILVIDASEDLNYDRNKQMLDSFLLRQAALRSDTVTGQATVLGMSRMRFTKHGWPE